MIMRVISIGLPLVVLALGPLAATPYEGVLMPTQDSHPALKITIVYENTLYQPGLTEGWGFSALIEYEGHTLLFDTGADGPALLRNMEALHINPLEIESVILSHDHGDHTGGLNALLSTGVQPNLYLLPSFPASFKQSLSQGMQVIETTPGQTITEGIFTTGEMSRGIPEQAIAIEIEQGLVVITGCAHPGIVAILERVKELSDQPIYFVLGGFHLLETPAAEVAAIVQDFRRLGVARVAPCHCTGTAAIAAFAEAYGDDFVQVGTGQVLDFEAPVEPPAG